MANEILTKDPVPIGEKVVDLICLAWATRRPIILRGGHGLGKSEIVEQAAKTLEIEYRCMDLSIMEPPDLLGMPKIKGNSLKYYQPATLPQGEKKKVKEKMVPNEGVLCFEELNRCDDAMQAPCLQLLTARRLNDYELPSGWSLIACVNPSNENYLVNDLDPALLSRFMVIDICADKKEWLRWSKGKNVHEAVTQVVKEHPDPFNSSSGVPPRTWYYVSETLNAFNDYEGLNEEIRRDALCGYLNTEWVNAVIEALIDLGEMEVESLRDDDDDEMVDPQSLKKSDKLPEINELLTSYTRDYRKRVLKLSAPKVSANMELLANTFNNKQNTKDAVAFCDHVCKPRHINNLNKLLGDIPNESKTIFANSLNMSIRDSFNKEYDPTGEVVKEIKLKDISGFKVEMGVAFYNSIKKKGRGPGKKKKPPIW